MSSPWPEIHHGAPDAGGPAGRELQGLLSGALRAGPLEVRALGSSMRPLLRPGDRVHLERRGPQRGDVALVRVGERILLHRLHQRRGACWLVRGDARRRFDGWVPEDHVLAVATSVQRERREIRLDRSRDRLLGLARARLAQALRFGRALVRNPRGARGV